MEHNHINWATVWAGLAGFAAAAGVIGTWWAATIGRMKRQQVGHAKAIGTLARMMAKPTELDEDDIEWCRSLAKVYLMPTKDP